MCYRVVISEQQTDIEYSGAKAMANDVAQMPFVKQLAAGGKFRYCYTSECDNITCCTLFSLHTILGQLKRTLTASWTG